jgi:23S rRNA pseudouridine1911/1915/1917 synthase
MAVRDDSIGRAAHTSYKILERLYAATLMEAQIHTGRTHQIRVHFQFIGHPLLGDETYGAKQNARVKEQTNYAAPRVMLHAKHLSFTHPRTKKPASFEAPLPEDFKAALKLLRVKN